MGAKQTKLAEKTALKKLLDMELSPSEVAKISLIRREMIKSRILEDNPYFAVIQGLEELQKLRTEVRKQGSRGFDKSLRNKYDLQIKALEVLIRTNLGLLNKIVSDDKPQTFEVLDESAEPNLTVRFLGPSGDPLKISDKPTHGKTIEHTEFEDG